MNSRRVITLLIISIVVLAGALWLASGTHKEARSALIGKPLFPDLKKSLNEVSELRIAKADGSHVTLRKKGANWVVIERDYAADGARIRKLLLDLAALSAQEEKTSSPARYGELSVNDVTPAAAGAPSQTPQASDYSQKATRIDIVSPVKTWSLINGKTATVKAGYVRVVGAKPSVLASPRLEIDSEPQRWLDKTIVDLPEARVQSVAVQPAKGAAYTVSRDKRETTNFAVSNVPKGRKLSYEGAGNAVAGALEALALDDLQAGTAPAANVAVENAKATFKTFDGLTVLVSGRKESVPGLKPDDHKVEHYFVAVTGSSADKATQAEAEKLNAHAAGKEFEISNYKYEAIFKPLDELLEALPEKPKKSAAKLPPTPKG